MRRRGILPYNLVVKYVCFHYICQIFKLSIDDLWTDTRSLLMRPYI
eukprot:COSAG02_NODE_21597_length_782_cov_0.827233_1_plen_45_part_10